MKKILLLLVLAGMFSTASLSQTLLQGNKMWVSVEGPSSGGPPPYNLYSFVNKLGGDTIINGLQYRILLSSTDSTFQQWTVFRFLRETPEGKVFFLVPDSADPERLCYDFSLQLGDTVSCISLRNLHQSPMIYTIQRIDTVFMAGRMRKVLSFTTAPWVSSSYGEWWIEGIGSTMGFSYNATWGYTGWFTELNCYSENDTLLYHNSSYPNCFMSYLNLTDLLSVKEQISIYPNPVSGISILKIPPQYFQNSKAENNNIIISDASGRSIKIMKIPASGELEINSGDFTSGLYFYSNATHTIAGKFIVL